MYLRNGSSTDSSPLPVPFPLISTCIVIFSKQELELVFSVNEPELKFK